MKNLLKAEDAVVVVVEGTKMIRNLSITKEKQKRVMKQKSFDLKSLSVNPYDFLLLNKYGILTRFDTLKYNFNLMNASEIFNKIDDKVAERAEINKELKELLPKGLKQLNSDYNELKITNSSATKKELLELLKDDYKGKNKAYAHLCDFKALGLNISFEWSLNKLKDILDFLEKGLMSKSNYKKSTIAEINATVTSIKKSIADEKILKRANEIKANGAVADDVVADDAVADEIIAEIIEDVKKVA